MVSGALGDPQKISHTKTSFEDIVGGSSPARRKIKPENVATRKEGELGPLMQSVYCRIMKFK